MRTSHRAASAGGLLVVAGLVAAIGVAPTLVSGADHLDAPTVKNDKRLDITDIYAFRASPAVTTLVLNVNPLTSPGSTKTAQFRYNALYEFKIDRNGDSFADAAYRIRFGAPVTLYDGAIGQNFEVRYATGSAARRSEWSGTHVASGKSTPYGRANRIASLSHGGNAFAGPRDDPFYFDLVGFTQFKTKLLEGSTDLDELLGGFTGTDTFAGTNISSIVLNVPNSRIGRTGYISGVWAETAVSQNGKYVQVERMGRPAINTVFNHTNSEKEASNRLDPHDDRAVERENVIGVLDAIGNVLDANSLPSYDAATKSAIADILLPDILTLELGKSDGFLNGRRLADDVIDIEFGVLTNNNITSDGVDANDKAFVSSFPYLAPPH